MIRFVRGRFYPQTDGTVIVETAGGLGLLISVPSNSPLYLNGEGDEVKVFTLMTVREDDVSLYGFSNMAELSLFRLLITVNGVGAKAGLAIMSILPAEQLKQAIAQGQADVLTQASGIGKKTAQRVVLELKDKVGWNGAAETDVPGGPQVYTTARKDAEDALVELGYSRAEAADAVSRVQGDDLTSEAYIRGALRQMM